MKRSEAIAHIVNVLRLTGNHYCDDGRDEQDAERILNRMEALGMFYCPVEDFGEFELRTVKGWEPEHDSSNSLDKLLTQMDNDKETQEILTKLVPDGVKLK